MERCLNTYAKRPVAYLPVWNGKSDCLPSTGAMLARAGRSRRPRAHEVIRCARIVMPASAVFFRLLVPGKDHDGQTQRSLHPMHHAGTQPYRSASRRRSVRRYAECGGRFFAIPFSPAVFRGYPFRPGTGNTYGVHYTDPATTPPEDYQLDICVSVAEPIAPNPQGVITKTMPAGRCARVRHIGSRHYIHAADWIYREWLPKSGEELRDYPIFFHYVNVGPDVKEHEMITDVYLPLK